MVSSSVRVRGWLGAAELEAQFGNGTAPPTQGELGSFLLAVDVDSDFFEKGAQQLFAVPVGGGGSGPHCADVGAQGGQGGAFVVGEGAGPGRLAAGQFGLGVGERGELGLPVGFEPSGHQAVVGVDGQVTPLGFGGFVAGLFDLAAPLVQGGVVVGLEDFRGGDDRGHPGRSERGQEGGGDGLVDLHAAHGEAIHAATVDQAAVGAVIAGGGVGALVVHGEAPSAATADGQSLQQGGAFADSTGAGLMRLGAGVGADAGLVGVVGGPVDVAGVVVHDQDLPVGRSG